MIVIYNVALFLFFIPASLALMLRFRKRLSREFFDKFSERRGKWNDLPGRSKGPLAWVHCASLGEVRAVEPLLSRLDDTTVLLTTMTRSGRDYAEKNRLTPHIFYAPLDFSFIVNPLMARVKPDLLVIVETELWPGLMSAASRCGVPTLIINGRISRSTLSFYRTFRAFWKYFLSRITCIAARSDEDARRFAEIGCPRDRIVVSGNIKYDHEFVTRAIKRSEQGFANEDLVWVCGSTREGEEEILVDVYREMKNRHPQLRLVIAPRHLNRAGVVGRLLERSGISFALRSSLDRQQADCLVIDTYGELLNFYAASDVVFVGGSLCGTGGQNPIEPASCGKPVLFGPSMENFLSESRIIETAGGGFTVRSRKELLIRLDMLLTDGPHRAQAGVNARRAVEGQRGALERTVAIIRRVAAGTGRLPAGAAV